jgi:hypothetical protein
MNEIVTKITCFLEFRNVDEHQLSSKFLMPRVAQNGHPGRLLDHVSMALEGQVIKSVFPGHSIATYFV